MSTDIDRLLLEGDPFRAKVQNKITQADISQTIEGAPTLTLGLFDADYALLESKIVDSRITTQLDKQAFELVQIRKGGDFLTLTLEDIGVSAMRKHRNPKKVAPNTMTREQFARQLVNEVRWLKFRGPEGKQIKARIEMARGKTKSGGGERHENTWDCLGRLAEEVNWARFLVGETVFFLPEDDLFNNPVDYVLHRHSPEVENIDFDWDIGKPVASLTATVHAKRWAVPPGSVIRTKGLGPATGKWLVSEVSGSLFSRYRTVTARKPEPDLPEPKPDKDPSASGHGQSGTGSVATGAGRGDWVWPVNGTVTQEFGGDHYGIDIGAPLGTPIVAARAGTVVFAGPASGYGNAIYINHGEGVICRYGHMAVFHCGRGQQVDQGQRIADVGQEGNATGPHLHFEYRPGDVPHNPREILGY